jgi:hypothetical protein
MSVSHQLGDARILVEKARDLLDTEAWFEQATEILVEAQTELLAAGAQPLGGPTEPLWPTKRAMREALDEATALLGNAASHFGAEPPEGTQLDASSGPFGGDEVERAYELIQAVLNAAVVVSAKA